MRAFGFAGGLTPPARLAGPGTVVFGRMHELPAYGPQPSLENPRVPF